MSGCVSCSQRFLCIARSIDSPSPLSFDQRASARYVQGLTVASEDFQKEVQAREEAEAEVKRLRAQMYGQNARLSMIDADLKRQNTAARRSRELAQSIHGLETDISKLRAERDITIAEVEELASSSK